MEYGEKTAVGSRLVPPLVAYGNTAARGRSTGGHHRRDSGAFDRTPGSEVERRAAKRGYDVAVEQQGEGGMSEPTSGGEPTPENDPLVDHDPVPPDEPAEDDTPGTPAARWTVPPPVAEVPGAPGLTFADIPARLIAYLFDVAIVAIVGATLAIALGFGQRTVTTTSTYVFVSGSTANISFALLGFAYFVFFWTGGRRATVGQRIFDIQVGNAFDGRPLTVDQAIKRWLALGSFLGLLSIVPGFGGLASLAEFAWVLVLLASVARNPAKQGLHDRFARTALVRPSGRASGGPALACLMIIGLLLITFVLVVIALIYLGSQLGPLMRPPGTTI